jgi:site-specific DNA-methyltransferase (adenine-specific)
LPEGVVLGDCRGVLAGLPEDCVDLVYIDPPFVTGQVRRLGSIRTGVGAKERVGFGGRRYPFEVVSDYRYRDDMSFAEYLEFLRQCLGEVHRVLRPTGSLY